MADDHINIIERKIIDTLRTNHSGVKVYGQYPEAVDAIYPAIIVELTSSGEFDRFMGQKVDFGGQTKTGELVGLVFTFHIIVDKESSMSIGDPAETYKQSFAAATTEIVERTLGNWVDIGYDPELELYGASCVYSVVFKNYR